MRNIIERFDNICKKADKVNKELKLTGNSNGYGPRFLKMQHKKQNRWHYIGIYDYYTKKYVLFEMVNLVGQKGKVPSEFYDMEIMLKNALPG